MICRTRMSRMCLTTAARSSSRRSRPETAGRAAWTPMPAPPTATSSTAGRTAARSTAPLAFRCARTARAISRSRSRTTTARCTTRAGSRSTAERCCPVCALSRNARVRVCGTPSLTARRPTAQARQRARSSCLPVWRPKPQGRRSRFPSARSACSRTPRPPHGSRRRRSTSRSCRRRTSASV